MKVIILAGGKSNRAKPIEDKNFVKIYGKFLIEWQLETLIKSGFNDFIIVGNQTNLTKLKELKYKQCTLNFVEQTGFTSGMADAVLSAKDFIDNEYMIISTNDVVEDSVWKQIKKTITSDKVSSFLVGYKVSRYFPGGYLKMDKNNKITGIIEKPGEGKEPSDMVNLVIHVHREGKKLIRYLENIKQETDDKYEQALDNMMSEKSIFKVIPYSGFWQAVKYPWHILKLTQYFLGKTKRKIHKSAKIAKTAVINGNVVIEERVKIFEHSVINGPCYIGKNTIIGNHTLVRQSSLGKACVIGSFTEICRSNLGNDVWTHKNYIGDSIIGNNVSFGSGTVTGNLRLDEQNISMNVNDEKINTRSNKMGIITGSNIRVGINTSFMPGVKIGSNTMIGATLVIDRDIPENSYVKAKKGIDPQHLQSGLGNQFGLDIRKNEKIVSERTHI